MTSLLVLGANSLVAPYLTERLARAQVDFLLASRQAPRLARGPWRACDLTAPPDWSDLNVPFDLISLVPLWLLPKHLEALSARGLKRVIACSSSSVIAKAESLHPVEREVASRLRAAEAALEEGCRQAGLPLLLLRPTLIYDGRSDANVTAMARFIRRFGFFPLCGEGSGLRQPLHADDLAEALLRAWRSSATGTHLLSGPETLTYRTMACRVFDDLGIPPRFMPLPPGPVHLVARLGIPGSGMLYRQAQHQAFEIESAAQAWLAGSRPFHVDFLENDTTATH